jgi:hypothetical protein
MCIIKENGKTFEGKEPYFIRIHDDKWDGKRTTYTRCSICKKLVSRQGRDYHRMVHIKENHDNKFKINF